MNSIKHKTSITIVVVLLVGMIGTHFADAAYYNDQMNKSGIETSITETNMGVDFSTVLGKTKGEVDCIDIRDPTNRKTCNYINTLRN